MISARAAGLSARISGVLSVAIGVIRVCVMAPEPRLFQAGVDSSISQATASGFSKIALTPSLPALGDGASSRPLISIVGTKTASGCNASTVAPTGKILPMRPRARWPRRASADVVRGARLDQRWCANCHIRSGLTLTSGFLPRERAQASPTASSAPRSRSSIRCGFGIATDPARLKAESTRHTVSMVRPR